MNYLNKKTIEDIDIAHKKVLLRCDFNVPIIDGKITDDRRITESLKTINYLINNHAKIILCSHLGRPKGVFSEEFSLKPVAKRLSELLETPIAMATDVVGTSAQTLAADLKDGEIMLLENVRFCKEETENDDEFSKKLASLAEVYINDAYGVSHRAHSSTCGVAKYLPSAIGFLMLKELSIMDKAINSPSRPFISILGGAKVSDKIGVIYSLLNKVDILILGGGMAYTFARARGLNIGTSLCEEDKLDIAREVMKEAKEKGVTLLMPVDFVVASAFSNDADFKTVDETEIPNDYMGMDIGPKSVELFSNEIRKAIGGTIIWNGPMGVCEFKNFEKGTKALAQVIAETNLVSVIGGGDSAAAVKQMGLSDKMTHISTGGGASLKLLEGVDLPAVVAIQDK